MSLLAVNSLESGELRVGRFRRGSTTPGATIRPMNDLQHLRVAVVHEWLETPLGSERYLAEVLGVLPQADVFAIVDFMPHAHRGFLGGRVVRTSFIQRLPLARRKFRSYLPLMPWAVEQFDMTGYDMVISNSHAVAKGVITSGNQLHVCICHSPMRYAWDLQHEYLQKSGLDHGARGLLARAMLHYLRMWDSRTANGVDSFIANSQFVAGRIRKAYRRQSEVVYPPVDVAYFTPGQKRRNFYLCASRLAPYKRVDAVVRAFGMMPHRRLVVIGEGGQMKQLRRLAGPNIEFLGWQSREALRDYMRKAKAFVFAASEDFGITTVEAQACGCPAIVLNHGGSAEIVIDRETGVFFDSPTPDAIVQAVEHFEQLPRPDERVIRRNACRFDSALCRRRLAEYLARQWNEFRSGREDGGAIESRRAATAVQGSPR